MKNDVRIATFSIRHELGPVYLGYRAPEGEYVTRRVVDAPVKLEFAAIPERIKSGFGVTSLELMDANLIGTTAEDCSAFRNALAEHGVSLGLVGASRAAGDADRQHREEDLAAIELLIDTAAELGTEQVRVILLPPPIVPLPAPASFEDMVAALRRLAAYAVARGVRLMLENDDVITADPAKLIPILDALGPEVGLVLDTGNIEPVMSEVSRSFIAGEEPNDVADPEPTYSVIEMLLPRAEVVHVKTYGFKEDGSSTVYDLKRVLQILVDGNFTGPVTIEYAGHDAAAADRVIQRTIDLIRAA